MKVSFNIPTFNRGEFLGKNLNILINQIETLKLQEAVEINISDNCSTDNTQELCSKLIDIHKGLNINYKRNSENIGPDLNFLSAMHMARGEYSLLWGDDDFLKENGLERVLELIQFGEKNEVSLMISSVSVVNNKGVFLEEKNLLRKDIQDLLVDFSDLNQVRSYFFLLKDMGGLLSFISDVIYKTSIIHETPYHEEFTGTHYAFLCHWWGWLAKGNKLYYSNQSFLEETLQYQKAYGYGVTRNMADYNGYTLIAEKLLKESYFKSDFLRAFLNLHPQINNRLLLLSERNPFMDKMLPKMIECGIDEVELKQLYSSCSKQQVIKSVIYLLLPKKSATLLKKLKKR